MDDNRKITTRHLSRTAYLYVRQSTLRQVLENTESTHRQYALRERAVALGWPLEQVVTIDSDLGHSGASAADREGFQKLVTEVSLGRAGIVLIHSSRGAFWYVSLPSNPFLRIRRISRGISSKRTSRSCSIDNKCVQPSARGHPLGKGRRFCKVLSSVDAADNA